MTINFLLQNVICAIILMTVEIYMMTIFLNKKLDVKNFKSWIIIVLTMIFIIINYIFFSNLIKIFVCTMILAISCKNLFDEKWEISIACAFINQAVMLVSETTFIIFITFFIKFDTKVLVTTIFGQIFTNIAIAVLSLILINIQKVRKFCQDIIERCNTINRKYLIIIFVSFAGIINMLLVGVYYKVNVLMLIFINSAFIVFSAYIVYQILEEKNINLKYRDENDALQDSLHNYENLVDHHRVISHENKNQLGVIKQMVESDDKTVVQYIEKLIKQTYEKDESLLEKTKRIPSGGLQGIIYQKLLLMKEKDIPNALNISRDIKESDFKKLDMDTNIDLCKIIGVFLDNAIDEVERLENKKIIVDVYMEDGNFCVKVTNDYGPGIDFSKIDDKGYTTKEDGHGYGLSLVKEIMERNQRFTNLRTITGKTFGQIIMVNNMSIDE